MGIIILGIFFFFLSSFFIAPLTVEKNTIPPLSGRANAFDYVTSQSWGNQNYVEGAKIGHNQSEYGLFSWSELNVYAMLHLLMHLATLTVIKSLNVHGR